MAGYRQEEAKPRRLVETQVHDRTRLRCYRRELFRTAEGDSSDDRVFGHFEMGRELQYGPSGIIVENCRSLEVPALPFGDFGLGGDQPPFDGVKELRFHGNGGEMGLRREEALDGHDHGRIGETDQGAAVHEPGPWAKSRRKGIVRVAFPSAAWRIVMRSSRSKGAQLIQAPMENSWGPMNESGFSVSFEVSGVKIFSSAGPPGHGHPLSLSLPAIGTE